MAITDKKGKIRPLNEGQATEAKQDDIITELQNRVFQLTNSLGSIINPATQGNQETLNSLITEAFLDKFYLPHDYDYLTSSTVFYEGRARCDGSNKWIIIQYDKTGGTETRRFANLSNNTGIESYAAAFEQRTLLNYTYLYQLTNLWLD